MSNISLLLILSSSMAREHFYHMRNISLLFILSSSMAREYFYRMRKISLLYANLVSMEYHQQGASYAPLSRSTALFPSPSLQKGWVRR